jgi:hypothetical protein
MSGSSQVEHRSDYYRVRTESACMNFAVVREDPGQEERWHRNWTEKAATWLARLTPILEQRFAMLAAEPDPDWPLVKLEDCFPLWNSYRAPETPPPWRVAFVGMSGPGMTEVTVAFSRLPSEPARDRLKRELIKDVAMLDQPWR